MTALRKLLPSEAPALLAHLLRLPPEDRTARFMHAVSDATIAAHVEAIDWVGGVVVGYFEAGVLRGAAELAGRLFREVEIAVTVEPSCQDQGIGTALLGQALLIARNRRFATAHVVCMGSNRRFQRVALKFFDHLSHEDGEASADMALERPTWFSLAEEGTAESFAWLGQMMERALGGAASQEAASGGG